MYLEGHDHTVMGAITSKYVYIQTWAWAIEYIRCAIYFYRYDVGLRLVFVQGSKMMCSVHAPQCLVMCARVKFVCSVNHTRQILENMFVNTYQIYGIIFLWHVL